ncbi:MAG: hypothetical protein AAGA48_37655 [Myxococcota bacterium]
MTGIRTVVIAAIALASPAAWACDEAEYQRLSEEQTRLAQRNAWSGVERAYQRLLKTRCELRVDQHQLGAESARVLGKTFDQLERLQLALELEDDPEARAQLESIEAAFGRVKIKGDPRRPPTLLRDVLPFAPDQQKSIEWARTLLAETGSFDGMLPAGEYVVGGELLLVEAGQPVELALPRRRNRVVDDTEPDQREGPAPSGPKGTFRYLLPIVHIGPSWLGTPETNRITTLSDGGHQFSPATSSVFGFTLSAGAEAGLTYGEPALGVAAGLGYTGGYGLDTFHAVSAWSLFVVRPGDARFAIGPQYQMLFGSGTGVADWFDRGQDPTSQPREDLRYSGWAWGPGLQAWAGYCPVDFEPFQGVVELGGTWHSDGARSYFTVGLRLGIVPRVPRFNG